MTQVYKEDFMEGISETAGIAHPKNSRFIVNISALHGNGTDKDYDVSVIADNEREAVHKQSDWDDVNDIREALESSGMVSDALYSTNFYVHKITPVITDGAAS